MLSAVASTSPCVSLSPYSVISIVIALCPTKYLAKFSYFKRVLEPGRFGIAIKPSYLRIFISKPAPSKHALLAAPLPVWNHKTSCDGGTAPKESSFCTDRYKESNDIWIVSLVESGRTMCELCYISTVAPQLYRYRPFKD